MAKAKKDSAKKDEKAEAAAPKSRGNQAWRAQIFLIFVMIGAIVFLPTTMLVFVGMLPTFVAFLVKGRGYMGTVVGIGAMNLAGISPFLIALWKDGQEFNKSLEILSDPKSYCVMYAAAALGHLINWAMGGIVGSIMYETGKRRLKEIEKRQEELIDRWGEEVSGSLALDDAGFPLGQNTGELQPPT